MFDRPKLSWVWLITKPKYFRAYILFYLKIFFINKNFNQNLTHHVLYYVIVFSFVKETKKKSLNIHV